MINHIILICLFSIALNLFSYKKNISNLSFKKELILDFIHFFLFQLPIGAYISYLCVLYFPIYITRAISNFITLNAFSSYILFKKTYYYNFILYILYWDFLAYLFHRISHGSKFLWNFHHYHHSIVFFTGFASNRVSFFENGFRIAFYTILFLPYFALHVDFPLYSGIIFSLFSVLKHSEIFSHRKIPFWPERIIQSPRMHALHHSKFGPYNVNFAEVFSFWDLIFKTIYIPKTERKIEIGSILSPKPSYLLGLRDLINFFHKLK